MQTVVKHSTTTLEHPSTNFKTVKPLKYQVVLFGTLQQFSNTLVLTLFPVITQANDAFTLKNNFCLDKSAHNW